MVSFYALFYNKGTSFVYQVKRSFFIDLTIKKDRIQYTEL